MSASGAAYVRRTFKLEQVNESTWRASAAHAVYGEPIEGERSAVIGKARARWGHFNFRDEAEAFAETFPPQLR